MLRKIVNKYRLSDNQVLLIGCVMGVLSFLLLVVID
jgi:hypothetical protein